jgi:ATP-dependent RNA helicase DHX29
MTGGVLLRRMQSDPLLPDVSAVIIDEVHERDATTDVLLSKLRSLLAVNTSIRIVLMSATADAEVFRSYFGSSVSVAIEGRTFPVRSLFLEDVLSLTHHRIDAEHPCAHRRSHHSLHRQSLNITGKGGNVSRTVVAWEDSSKEHLNPYFDPQAFSHVSDSHVLHSLAIVDESLVNIDLIEDLLQVTYCLLAAVLRCGDSATGHMWSASFGSPAGRSQPGPTAVPP